jgi:hypothetical protein
VRIARKAAGLIVHVQAHDAGEKVLVDPLAVEAGVVGVAFIPQGQVEIPVRAEMEIAGIMIGEIVALIDHHYFRTDHGLVRVGGRDFKARQPVMPGAGAGRLVGVERVPDVEETVRRIPGMKLQREQSFLLRRYPA